MSRTIETIDAEIQSWIHNTTTHPDLDYVLEQVRALRAEKATLIEQAQAMLREGSSWDLVIEDIYNRENLGLRKYGKALTVNTTEDMLQHAYEEALDLVVYLKTEIIQRHAKATK